MKQIYRSLPSNLDKIFQPRNAAVPLKLTDLSNLEPILSEIFAITQVQVPASTTGAEGNVATYNLIPKGSSSLKVLAELPIIVILMYQLYKQHVYQEVAEFIPLIMNTILLQPQPQQKNHEHFNKEIFVDFMAAQIKTLSFLAYVVRIYQQNVNENAGTLAPGIITLMKNCPQEVAHLRKELLIATRHILATDLRSHFITHIDQLFNEQTLIGNGWTTNESLRPLAYSMVADLVHHIRPHLSLKDLNTAINLYSKNVLDEYLPTSMQTMSCKLLLNLVECLKALYEQQQSSEQQQQTPQQRSDQILPRELLMKMLEVFVLKFKNVARCQLPTLQKRLRPPSSTTAPSQPQPAANSNMDSRQQEEVKIALGFPSASGEATQTKPEDKGHFGFPSSPSSNYTIVDCRNLVRTLVCGVKTITWGIPPAKHPGESVGAVAVPPASKHFYPKEAMVFIRLVRYAMEALDIYSLAYHQSAGPSQNRIQSLQTVRSKEEKEVLETFAGVFTTLHPTTFREVFQTTIHFFVERIHQNYALQIIANTFLANSQTSPIFATILVEYLLERMEEMGTNLDKSNLYLKLFKLVFGSVSLFAAENEQMLRPHLHNIVNKSMELALDAKEPYNYFLLLRALFRSIGGGSHDLLYQEFLPLLPSLLQGLNSLQSGLHKQHMKDLFVELCLTVPVRLSSLLPYLPMLMDPLVSALNGSQTLVSQGLRTLELCVDNLQPDFLYDHIQPVRAELMQALWRTLRNPTDNIAVVSFRVLGKFGGGNRKMMTEPQKLTYTDNKLNFTTGGTTILVNFQDGRAPVHFPLDKIIETAANALKNSNTDAFYRIQCWEVIKGFLAAHIQQQLGDEEKYRIQQFFSHNAFCNADIPPTIGQFYKCPDPQLRKVHEVALTAMFLAAAIREVRQTVMPFMYSVVRHYVMVAVSQQSGPINLGGRQHKLQGMDPLVLIDALTTIMGHEEKELCKPGHLALIIIIDTATCILGSRERASQLPLIEYLADKMCSLCYERAWYSKLGGCIAIKFLFEKMPVKWVFAHQYQFLRALLFVMMDLAGEVSSGAKDMAKSNLEKMLQVFGAPIPLAADESNRDLVEAQQKSLHEVTQELVKQVTCPNNAVRAQAIASLRLLAQVNGITVTQLMEPHKQVLEEMIPPKKHSLRHMPVNAQIGVMEGNMFCTSLEPRLFTFDLNIQEHKNFFAELVTICESEDINLIKISCYKGVNNFTPLKVAAVRAVAACSYIGQHKQKIFIILLKALSSQQEEIQKTAFESLKTFLSQTQIDDPIISPSVHTQLINNQLQVATNWQNLNKIVLKKFNYLAQLFPSAIPERFAELMVKNLRLWIEAALNAMKQDQKFTEHLNIVAQIVDLYHLMPPLSDKYVETLMSCVFRAEKLFMMEAGSMLREPLRRFLKKFPEKTITLLFVERNMNEDQIYRFVKVSNNPAHQYQANQSHAKLIDPQNFFIFETIHSSSY